VLGIVNRDGAFAEFLSLPVANIVPVPDGVSDRQAVFAEPLAACYEVPEQVHVEPGWSVAVLGDGKLGLLMAQVAALLGCEVTAAGHHPEKLAIVERRGISTARPEDLPKRSFQMVVECTGSAQGLALAGTLVRPRGIVVLKSTVAGASELNLAPFVVDEVTVVGSRCGPFGPALRALAAGRVDVESLITAEYPLEQAEQAFAHAQRKGTLKVLLRVT
jgi:threonine dehydrogenase-like Zn-dependent dehydrogenase